MKKAYIAAVVLVSIVAVAVVVMLCLNAVVKEEPPKESGWETARSMDIIGMSRSDAEVMCSVFNESGRTCGLVRVTDGDEVTYFMYTELHDGTYVSMNLTQGRLMPKDEFERSLMSCTIEYKECVPEC